MEAEEAADCGRPSEEGGGGRTADALGAGSPVGIIAAAHMWGTSTQGLESAAAAPYTAIVYGAEGREETSDRRSRLRVTSDGDGEWIWSGIAMLWGVVVVRNSDAKVWRSKQQANGRGLTFTGPCGGGRADGCSG